MKAKLMILLQSTDHGDTFIRSDSTPSRQEYEEEEKAEIQVAKAPSTKISSVYYKADGTLKIGFTGLETWMNVVLWN